MDTNLNRVDWCTDADHLDAVLLHIKVRANRWRQAAEETPCPTLENRAEAEQHFYEECCHLAGREED